MSACPAQLTKPLLMQNLTYPLTRPIAAVGWRSSTDDNNDAAAARRPNPSHRRSNMVVGSRREKTLTVEETHFHHTQDGVLKRHSSDSDATQNDDDYDDKSDDNSKPSWNWDPYSVPNPAFDEYYKEQGIVALEEWDTFIKFLRKPLPAAFRINACGRFFMDIRSQLENDFLRSSQNEYVAGDETEAVRPLPWYPDTLAWYSNFSRRELRKNQNLERFREFVKTEDEIGNIARQEAVSMVPPLLLDMHSEHLVLDMCASPGSKTYQLLEIIHRSTATGSLPDGLVVANDLGVKRCDLLIHKMKRMCTSNLIVTNHEAQCFPRCHAKHYTNTLEMDSNMQPCLQQLRFDRVLCDVPCSGDGTLRKAPQVWTMWNVGIGNGLHGLQVQIAMRVENEAVVSEILRRCEGSIELVDVSEELPQLVSRPGLRKWKVQDKGTWFATYRDVPQSRRGGVMPSMFPSGRNFANPPSDNCTPGLGEKSNSEDVSGTENLAKPVQQSHAGDSIKEEISNFPLERCMRIMPHDQNSGAFFIAVFHKIAPLPERYEKTVSVGGKLFPGDVELQENQKGLCEDVNAVEGSQAEGKFGRISPAAARAVIVKKSGNSPESGFGNSSSYNNSFDGRIPGENTRIYQRKSRGKSKLHTQRRWWWIDPVVFLADETIIDGIRTFYGIDKSFPLIGHLVIRNADSNCGKRIYYISKSVKDLLELNSRAGDQLKIFYVGLKMFERKKSREGSSLAHFFRITSEGLPVLLPYITKQILFASAVDFKHLLQYKSIKFSSFSDCEFGEKASELMPGCCVVVIGTEALSNSNLIDHSPIAIGCWKGKTCLNVMVSDIECQELLERIFLGAGDWNKFCCRKSGPQPYLK